MKVFLNRDPSLQDKLQNATKQQDLGNVHVHIHISGDEVIFYTTDYDVSAVSLTKEDLQKILNRMP